MKHPGNKTNHKHGKDNYNFKDLTGMRFGSLLVIERVLHINKHGKRRWKWKCRCDCGNESFPRLSQLTCGKQTSCWKCGRKRARENTILSSNLALKRRIFRTYTRNAKSKNLEFTLSFDTVIELVSKDCYYCSRYSKPYAVDQDFTSSGEFHRVGIDRIDNKVGYTVENCIPCCTICNYAKRALSQEEFYDWVSCVYNNLHKLGKVKELCQSEL